MIVRSGTSYKYAPLLPLFRVGAHNRLSMALLIFFLGSSPAAWADGGVDWRKDYESAREEARQKGRLILLHFYLDGRPLCAAMNEETFAQAEVARAARERFVSVRVDVDARPELFEATIGGRGGLATCVVDVDGDVLSALHGFAAPPAFLQFLSRAEAASGRVKAAREVLAMSPGDRV